MAGTKEGGKKASEINRKRYGKDFYSKIGKEGAKKYRLRQKLGVAKPRGFAVNKELARVAGAKGGRKSRRGSFRR